MRHSLTRFNGPITLVTGKHRRVTFMEVPNDINAMIDAAKIADLVCGRIFQMHDDKRSAGATVDRCILWIRDGDIRVFAYMQDARRATYHGCTDAHGHDREEAKAESAEEEIKAPFLDRGLPRRQDVLLHAAKRRTVHAQRSEESGTLHLSDEIPTSHLAHHTSVRAGGQVHPLPSLFSSNCYTLRYEDVTDTESTKRNLKCNRSVLMYGYVRGTNLKENQAVHIPGVRSSIFLR